jgi:hypothetical protein
LTFDDGFEELPLFELCLLPENFGTLVLSLSQTRAEIEAHGAAR